MKELLDIREEMESDATQKSKEVQELCEMVQSYEAQIRELQEDLEDQIETMKLKEETKFKISLDQNNLSAEMQQVKLLLQDMILTKDEIERQTEELVKSLLEKDANGQ